MLWYTTGANARSESRAPERNRRISAPKRGSAMGDTTPSIGPLERWPIELFQRAHHFGRYTQSIRNVTPRISPSRAHALS
ncbi:hypothetical protein GCM10012279_31460 [Micromonospora yangpuensis]|nr:hypothetical protein GCM10012279_31460 [Micromonospora yangpuensis]